MQRIKISLVLGARPQIVKSSRLIHLAVKDKQLDFRVIHTGQHYDYELTKIFFDELELPDPVANLNVGSGTHADQTARIMIGLEKILVKYEPDLVLVPGDTNSTLAGAVTAAKLHLPVAHMEAGARSYDPKMPEEINRRLTDHCSSLLFTPSKNCTNNLLKEGIGKDWICQAGDTMYDVLLQQMPKAEKTIVLNQLNLIGNDFALVTVHRPENVDNAERLTNIVDAITEMKPITIVFPVHPRTRKNLKTFGLESRLQRQKHVRLIEPVGYLETLKLVKNARILLTDSGGMQKEAFWLKTPCITLRENTEWTETVSLKANYLTGSNTSKIVKTAREFIDSRDKWSQMIQHAPNPYGDGKASEKIIEAIKIFLGKGRV